MSGRAASKMRILVGASSFADAATALHIAGRVAQDTVTSLGGLLVDDEDTRVACAIPNQRIISASGAVLMTPSQAQIHTLMNAEARAFRQLLQKIADPPALEWSFDRQMGDLISTAMRAASGWDALIFGYRSSHPFIGKVVVFAPPVKDAGGLLSLSQRLAQQLRTDLVAFNVGAAAPPPSGHDRPFDLAFETPEQAIAALDKINAQVVLIDLSRSPIRSPEQLRNLVRASRCPVVVLGASSFAPTVEHTVHFPAEPGSKEAPSAS
tara:strand:+ start:2790 stop:3587 length:798 start_codon:yes stop_codon:yes gene_type:complete